MGLVADIGPRERVLRAATVAMGIAIVNGKRFAEAWTHGRPGKRRSLLRLVAETMRGQRARVFAISVSACSLRARARSNRPRCLGVRLNRALWATIGNALRMH